MANMNYVVPAQVTSFNSASMTSSLQVVNSSGFPGPVVLLRITNGTTLPVAISFDGTHFHDYVLSGQSMELNFQNNAQPNSYQFAMRQGGKVYVAGTAGTGYLYVAAYYAATQN